MTYLDYAATTPLLSSVKKAMSEASDRFYANASALHTPGHLALNEIEKTRELLAELINASPSEIIFTSGSSESNNTVIHTFAGQNIAASEIEHHSILEPIRAYAAKALPIRINSAGIAVLDNQIWADKPQLVSICQANNELGSIQPLADWITAAHQHHCLVHSDMTQALGKLLIDVKKLDIDYATFSAHKIGGPIGIGALYIKNGVPFKPLILGGNQEQKRRGGTYNTIGIIGFGAALQEVLDQKTWAKYAEKIRPLRDQLAKHILAEVPGSSLNSTLDSKTLPNILNVSFQAAEGESIQLYLDAAGVIVSTGSACASGDIKPSHVLMAKTGDAEVAHSSIRFSFGLDNTVADIDRVMAVLPDIIKKLQGMSTIGVKNV